MKRVAVLLRSLLMLGSFVLFLRAYAMAEDAKQVPGGSETEKPLAAGPSPSASPNRVGGLLTLDQMVAVVPGKRA